MSAPFNVGTLFCNHLITPEAKHIIDATLEIKDTCYTGGEMIEICGIQSYNFDLDIKVLIDNLKPLGYIINGMIEYYGDYDGRYDVKDNVVTEIAREDFGLYDATDETLISMLEQRGYTVIKKED